jgi:hypothetical protein
MHAILIIGTEIEMMLAFTSKKEEIQKQKSSARGSLLVGSLFQLYTKPIKYYLHLLF